MAKAREHTHGGSLACTVGTEKAEDFTPMNAERNMVDGGKTAEAFGQVVHFDDVIFTVLCLIVLQAGRTKDVGKLLQDAFRSIDAMYPTFVDEGDTVALAGLVDDGRGSNDRDTLFLEACLLYTSPSPRDRG